MPAPAATPLLSPLDDAFLRRLRTLSLSSRHVARLAIGRGRHRSRSLGPGTEFADYREYSAGDDYRHVDWNAYARSERLLVRQHEQESELSVSLLLDCSASMGTGTPAKLVYAVQLAAAIAHIALQRLDRLSIATLNAGVVSSLTPVRGLRATTEVFEFLRAVQPGGTTRLDAACRAFCSRTRRRGLAILISDLYDPAGTPGAIDVLRRARFEPHVIRIVDAAEVSGLAEGEYELVDSETAAVRRIAITPAINAAYRAARSREAFALRRACHERSVPLHVIETRISLEDAVLSRLRHAGLFR